MGNKVSLKEELRANKRVINRAVREMDRERATLQREEAKLQQNIKKMAQEGQTGAVRIMAKDLVRTRQYISKLYVMNSQLKGLGVKMQMMKTSQEMAMSMGSMTKSMKSMNQKMNVAGINKIMMEFERENAKAEMTQEMMDDVLDDALDDGEAGEEEEERIMAQVLDELGVSLTEGLMVAPSQTPVGAQAEEVQAAEAPARKLVAEEEGDGEVDDLESRLNQLRRG
jgi:charged multivesicular body protein 2A